MTKRTLALLLPLALLAGSALAAQEEFSKTQPGGAGTIEGGARGACR
jgi:hypothetical protein